jgi:hypothetical protein
MGLSALTQKAPTCHSRLNEHNRDFATVIRSMIRTHRATYPALLEAVFRLKRAQEA